MKITLFLILMILSLFSNARSVSNICDNDNDRNNFKEISVIKVDKNYAFHTTRLELPKVFRQDYTLRSLVLYMYETEIQTRGDKSRERTELSLISSVQIIEVDNVYHASVSISPKTSTTIKLIASYKDDPPGVRVIDGEECQFELLEMAHN